MIALRRAPGAKRKPPKPPREPRQWLARLKPRRRPLTPTSLSRWEMIVVTTLSIISVAGVAAIGFVISYSHMFDWALANGEPEWRAQLFPLAVDGAIVAASLVLYADSRAGRRSSLLAYFITVVGIGWSVGANIGHTWVSWIAAMLIAGWPPIAMALSVELLFKFIRRWRGQADAEVRKAARRKPTEPVTVPEPEPVEVSAEPEREPVQLPLPRPESGQHPAWMPEQATARTAALAFLAVNPGADAPALRKALEPYFSMDASYARRIVRQHGEQSLKAVGQEG